jgi:signal transduction histidine kinase
VELTVADNGLGIDPDKLEKVFAFGYTTKRDGHGFGLHSSANAAVELGGRLRAHSGGPGTGATFTLEAPVTPPKRGEKKQSQWSDAHTEQLVDKAPLAVG